MKVNWKDAIRQGDVYLVPIDAIPANATEKPRDGGLVVLAYGETTGHMHALASPAVAELAGPMPEEVASRETTYLRILEDAWLRHGTREEIKSKSEPTAPDHDSICLPAGSYIVIRQEEYSVGKMRRVAD